VRLRTTVPNPDRLLQVKAEYDPDAVFGPSPGHDGDGLSSRPDGLTPERVRLYLRVSDDLRNERLGSAG
jgi:hypothetical protein